MRSFMIYIGVLLVAIMPSAVAASEALTIFVVRHAERADSSRDAVLSDVGKERAKRLARIIGDAEIDYVHSTDFKRTKSTAGPTASAAGVEVSLYSPRDLHALNVKLLKSGGRHLVVGHAETMLKTIELLGGDGGFPLDKKSEFDRLYIVTVSKGSAVSTVMLRY